MEKYFSGKNINNQINILMKNLGIKDTPETRNKCKVLIVDKLKTVFSKYKNKKPKTMDEKEFYDRLNKKSLETSIKYCEEQIAKKKNINNNERETDIYGKRQVTFQQRSKFSSSGDKKISSELPTNLGGYNGDNGQYASIDIDEGKIITADGRSGNNFMDMTTTNDKNKTHVKDALEEIYNKRINEYAPNPKRMDMNSNKMMDDNNINNNDSTNDVFSNIIGFNEMGFGGLDESFPELKGTLKQEGPLERVTASGNNNNGNGMNYNNIPNGQGANYNENNMNYNGAQNGHSKTHNENNMNYDNTVNTHGTNNRNNVKSNEKSNSINYGRDENNINYTKNDDDIKKIIQDCIKNELQIIQKNITMTMNNSIQQNLSQLIENFQPIRKENNTDGINITNNIDDIISKTISKTLSKNTQNLATYIIKSNEHTVPQKYNSYVVKFINPLKNIKSIKLLNFSLPHNDHNITPMYNKLIINNNCAQLNSGNYSLTELLNQINQTDDDVEGIIIGNKIKIRSISGNKLCLKNNIKCEDGTIIESVITLFGFKKNLYEGNSEYISDEPYNVEPSQFINLHINDMKVPFCTIDLIKQKIITSCIKEFNPQQQLLPALYISFKKTCDDKLFDFCSQPHSLELAFECA